MTSTPTSAATAASRPPTSAAPARVLAQIAALQRMDADELRKHWAMMMDAPPSGTTAGLSRRLIHRVQELAHGGISPATKAALDAVARQDAGEADKPPAKAVTPGTRFLREWRGQRHEVTALDEGFEYLGRKYRSLTAAAKAITGQHTNGQVFFGIRPRNRKGKA